MSDYEKKIKQTKSKEIVKPSYFWLKDLEWIDSTY